MRLIILLALLLSGCASTSMEDLTAQHVAACVKDGESAECNELTEKMDRQARIREYRRNAEPPDCPKGYVAYCDSRTHMGCGRRFSRTPVQYSCVKAIELLR